MRWLEASRSKVVVFSVVVGLVVGSTVKADFTFGEPVNLGPTVNSSVADYPNCFSADGLEMYLASDRFPKQGGWDIWVAKRETIDDDWGAPMNLGPKINGPTHDGCASISVDGLVLYFDSNRSGGHGGLDIWLSRRQTKDGDWGDAVNLGPIVNSSSGDGGPWITTDGLELYFDSNRSGGFGSWDIWVSRRATKNDPWGEPTNLGSGVNSSDDIGYPSLSTDGLLLLCSDTMLLHPGGFGASDIWMSRRKTIADPWGELVNLGPRVNGPRYEGSARLSPDSLTLYLYRPGPTYMGGRRSDIWQASILPIVDFTGDGMVELADLLGMIEYWGTDHSFYDIGPMPWGDGKVDAADLEVMMGHWGQEAYDPTLIAHWKLDETEGVTACDSVLGCDGIVSGDPAWESSGGQVDGALRCDGVDDYVSTPFALDPGDGPFSVYIWVKGGAPGQVIVSQADGANWLLADVLTGALMTGLSQPVGRFTPPPLVSEAIITDGDWHRVGFTWDGTNRCLYVDDVLVAEDTQTGFADCSGGLNIGCGTDMAPGAFFSGLIDDVRIYNRAVRP